MITLEKVRLRAELDAQARGYYLNPDPAFLDDLTEGLRKNEERYGYPSCPCRAATGIFEIDRDIICPCDYRDPDVEEFDACYCALYVSREAHEGTRKLGQIPERRPQEKLVRALGLDIEAQGEMPPEKKVAVEGQLIASRRRMFYCKQCGYVVFREEPPYICPICRAKREMFAEVTIMLEPLSNG